MALQSSLFNLMLDEAVANVAELSLHTADPGGDGSDEVSGGAYARQPVAWQAASGGAVAMDGDVTWQVPESTEVTHAGMWGSGGAWHGSIPLSPTESFGAAGELSASSLTVDLSNA